MEKTVSPTRRLSTILLSFAMLLGLSSVGSVALAGDVANNPVVYIDGANGDDGNDGTSADTKVKTFARVERLAAENATVYVSGTMDIQANRTLDFKKFTVERADGFTGPLLNISGKTVSIVGNGATIDGKNAVAEAPVVTMSNSNVQMSGVTVTGGINNTSAAHEPTTENWLGTGGGIGVRGGQLAIENATVTGNTAVLGGGIFADGTVLTLNSGARIDANTVKWEGGPNHYKASGGGIFQASVAGESTTYVHAGATVNGNDASTGSSGGGISTGRTKAEEARDYLFNVNKASVYLDGGSVSNNVSGLVGGGIFVNRNSYAELTAGEIVGNVANPNNDKKVDFSGGGVYAEDAEWDRAYYQTWDPASIEAYKQQAAAEGRTLLPGGHVKIQNAKITENSAYRGGGLALCQMGDGYMSPDAGAAIYANSASNKGKDVWISRSNGSTSTTALSPTALAGIENQWQGWRDGTGEEVDPYFIGNSPAASVKNWVYFDNALTGSDEIDAAARLVISGNSTTRYGGGIANNGMMEIGEFIPGFFIRKVDLQTNQPLAGAGFRLSGPFGYERLASTATDASEEGVAAFRELVDGEYVLVEDSAPDTYPDLDLTWKVSVVDGEISVTDADGNPVNPIKTVSDNAGHIFPYYSITNDKYGEPALATLATVNGTSEHVAMADGEVTITDTVSYTGLMRGTWTIRGTLMDKATGQPLVVNGEQVTAETTGQLEGDGTVEMNFGPIDGKALAGTTVVVYEELIHSDGNKVAEHNDINDEAQTIYFPNARTNAADGNDGDSYISPGGKSRIVDTVTYTNLLPGKEYTVTGTLHKKSDGSVLEAEGATASTTFVPQDPDGLVQLTFEIDPADLVGDALVAFESVTYGDIEVAVHADINDEAQTVHVVEIGTTAADSETGTHIATADENVTINDVVAYKGLVPGKEYRLEGKLVKRHDTSDIPGAVATQTFVASETGEGTVEMAFTFDGRPFAGFAAVAFEKLYDGDKLVASHEDKNDAAQTVTLPKIATKAADAADGDQVVPVDDKVTIVDTVSYWNLLAGKEYTVTGVLMDKATGKPILVDGEQVTASTAFTADKAKGEVEIEFTLDASELANKRLVAFETMTFEGREIAVHADIEDRAQTVTVSDNPQIGTTATDKNGEKTLHAEDGTVEIVDTVVYSNLVKGKEYTLKGVLMDKASEKPVLVDGEAVSAEKTFKAENANGEVEVVFEIDITEFGNKDLVVFEKLFNAAGQQVAKHEQINDAGQTVHVEPRPLEPTVATVATDSETGDHIALADDSVVIKDVVEYTDLEKGVEHTLTGVLMNKETGTELLVDGQPVTASVAFTPAENNGTVELVFPAFNASALKAATLVAFETVSVGDKVIVEHKDINDEAQTVVVPEARTNATDKADGDHKVNHGETVTIVDTVTYRNLIPGKTYVVSGTLMDKATGAPLEAEGATASKEFTATKANGSVELEFAIDTSALAGKRLVAFETVTYEGKNVATHEDLDDRDQTVVVSDMPGIGTIATDGKDGDKLVEIGVSAQVKDVVRYENLKPGVEYTLTGELVTKASNGETVVAVATGKFTPEAAAGEVELVFDVDTTNLRGERLVAFEKVFEGEKEIATHADIDDADQTVTVEEEPGIEKYVNRTVHEDIDLGGVFTYDVLAYVTKDADKATITDTLVDDLQFVSAAADVKVVDLGTAEPDHKPNGSVAGDGPVLDNAAAAIDGKTLTVVIDPAQAVRGHWVKVTFEAKIADGKKLADLKHATITKNEPVLADEEHDGVPNTASYEIVVGNEGRYSDESNTVTVKPNQPEIATVATDNKDGDKELEIGAAAEVKDTVRYENLKPGTEYRLVGQLVTKASKGETVVAEAEATFTPTDRNGEAELVFTVDTTKLQGEKLVAFERVYLGDVEIAIHADIKDADQTVTVGEQPEIEKYVNKNVHKTIDLDEVFTYDVLAYVTKDADKAEIVDTLVDDLQFVGEAGDVKVVDLGAAEPDHKPNGTVAKDGTVVASEIAAAAIDGKTLTVSIEKAESLRGHWVKVTFEAKIADGKKLADLKFATVTENAPVLSGEAHEGVPNEASYTIFVGNEGKYSDETNTVTVNPKEPRIATVATNADENAADAKTVPAAEAVQVKDVVNYEGLKAGTKYVMSGTLVSKKSGGAVAEASAEFTTDATGAGQTELVFTVNTWELQGDQLVAFETALEFDTRKIVATHEDIDDEAQTVGVETKNPELRTVATDAKDGDKLAEIGAEVQVKDVVEYKELQPGKTYALKGSLVKKSDGEAVATAETEFQADASGNGTAEMVFTVDTAKLQGEKLVVFEYLWKGSLEENASAKPGDGTEDLKHEDLGDADQTVSVEEKPEIEKYVNKNVHKTIDLDEVFTYDVLAYVTKDADKATITDTLVDDLRFVSAAADVKVADLGASVDHAPNGSVNSEGSPVGADVAAVAIDGKTLTVSIGKAESLRGHWVKVTFEAKIADGKKLADLKFATVTKNAPVKAEGEHAGVPNTASYQVVVGNEGKYSDESNTVTVNPKEPKIATTATNADENAADAKTVPAAEKAQVKDVVVYEKLKAGTKYTMSGQLVTKADGGKTVVAEKSVEFTTDETGSGSVELVFDIDATTYAGQSLVAFEKAIEAETQAVVATHEDINDKDQTVKVDKKPEIEKYVNRTVHEDIDLGDVFTYDVLAYVTADADKATITDELVDDLEFVTAADAVKVVDLGTAEPDHKPNGSVAGDGPTVAAAKTIEGQKLTVTIAPADTMRGHWVKVTFDAKIKAGLKVGDLATATVTENAPVKATGEHAGVPNKASYEIEIPNGGTYTDESNTVTVNPSEPSIATIATDAADGDKLVDIAGKVEVKDVVAYANLQPGATYRLEGKLVTKASKGAEVLATNTVEFVASKTGEGEAELVFTVDTTKIAGQDAVAFEKVFSVATGALVATHEDLDDENQTVTVGEEKPEIEKYVNKKVHADIDLDEVFTYDVLAYVTKDADKAEIVDELVEDLQFASEAGDIKVVDLGALNDHKPNGTVAGNGTAVETAKAEIKGRTLTVTIDPAQAVRGHWVKVTFDAKIADGKKLADLANATVTDNGTVKTGESHEGVPNKASCKVYVGNKATYADESNTVTVKPGSEPAIATIASDAVDGDKMLKALADGKVKDVVRYENLRPGVEYVMSGELKNKADGKTVAVASATFTPEAASGTVEMVFDVDAAALRGAALVAFEKAALAADGKVVATHEDIEDKDQTVYVPALGTIATDALTKDHIANGEGAMTVNDVVAYEGLEPNADYTLKAILVTKSSQTVVGTAEAKVKADETGKGTQIVTFDIPDASALKGETVVAFEYMFEGDANGVDLANEEGRTAASEREDYVGEHADINDAAQSVQVPEARTNAADVADGDQNVAAAKTAAVVDRVTYRNLIPGKTYTVNGKLVDKATGKTVYAEASKTFEAPAADGAVELVFTVDTSELAGTRMVAFEEVVYEGKAVAVHADLNDAAQTVTVEKTPKIRTVATDGETGEKVGNADGTVTVIDRVDYVNLKPGAHYTLKGKLVRKSDGSDIPGAIAEVEFAPEAADGSVNMTFGPFDGTALAGDSAVAYEYLSEGALDANADAKPGEGNVIARHEDLGDADQTVTYPAVRTLATEAETGAKLVEARGEVTIADTVVYSNLEAGKTYTISGQLMNKATGEPIEGAVAATTFKAKEANGSETLEFTFNVEDLIGASSGLGNENPELIGAAVAFEKLYVGDAVDEAKLVGRHEDLNDADQTVEFRTQKRGVWNFPVAKLDTKGAAVAGAKLHLEDASGAKVAAWVSGEEPYIVSVPDKDAEYTLVEDEAPAGYKIADPVKISVQDGVVFIADEQVDTVTMVDEEVPENPGTPTPTPSESAEPTPAPTPSETGEPTPGPTPSATGEPTPAPTDGVTPRNDSVTPVSKAATPTVESDVPVATTSRSTTTSRKSTILPVTGLSKTGAAAGGGLALMSLLAGAGAMMVRKREKAKD